MILVYTFEHNNLKDSCVFVYNFICIKIQVVDPYLARESFILMTLMMERKGRQRKVKKKRRQSIKLVIRNSKISKNISEQLLIYWQSLRFLLQKETIFLKMIFVDCYCI